MNTVWHDYSKVDTSRGTAVAIGNFDGLHMGHRKLMDMLAQVAKENDVPSVIYTFDKHPINVIKGENTLPLIADNTYKQELLANCEADTLFFENFESIKDLSPEDFVRDILVGKLNMKIAVVGRHNHYGKDSKGDVKLLRELGQEYGFAVYMIEPLYFGDVVCSSSKIRELIADGEIEKANEMLGHPFKISNVVVKDKMLGRTLGFPTANMIPDPGLLLPQVGVYGTNTLAGGKRYPSITNIGAALTIGEGEPVRIETYIIGFEGDLYGETLEVEFLTKIRDNEHFDGLDSLKSQLEKDVEARLDN
ncbi:MAG: bifunctional riboflavin kinase/FAD synthetase [Clostridia bacterium]|nr:bifunctional riboflavin kinase/FAD synthetase [Clostridia bacterium]